MLKRWNFLKTGFYEGIKDEHLHRRAYVDRCETRLLLFSPSPVHTVNSGGDAFASGIWAWESARRVRESFFMKVGVGGAGIFGVPAALELRSRGHDVTLFEQGTLPYEKASSTDVSKVIRRDGYGANETYLQLLRRATEQWREWQERLGETLYVQTGKLRAGLGDGLARLHPARWLRACSHYWV